MNKITMLLVDAGLSLVAIAPAAAHVDNVPMAYLGYYVHVDPNDTLNVRTRPNGVVIASLLNGDYVYVQDQIDHWAFITAYNNGRGIVQSDSGWVHMAYLKNCGRVDGE
jgi:hypothetical protein